MIWYVSRRAPGPSEAVRLGGNSGSFASDSRIISGISSFKLHPGQSPLEILVDNTLRQKPKHYIYYVGMASRTGVLMTAAAE
jgi:hypothetical protein